MLLLCVGLVGCAPTTPAEESSETPASVSSASPSAEEQQAYDDALAALRGLVRTTQDLYEKGGDTSALAEFASGAALDNATASVDDYAARGYTGDGEITFEPYDHEVRTNDRQAPVIPNGEVVIRSCFDYSAWKLTAADGSPVPVEGAPRSTFEHHVVLDTVSDAWLVTEAAATGGEC